MRGTEPAPRARRPLAEAAVLAADAEGRPIVSVHVKRTFHIRDDGSCERTVVDVPLLNSDPSDDASDEDDGAPPELDIIPYKDATDLIVMASARAPRGQTVRRMAASIEVGNVLREYLVQGDRRCLYRGEGAVEFSAPDLFETIPLRYEHAYGGCDPTVQVTAPRNMVEALRPHPGIYPRNPAGRGYVVTGTKSHVDGLLLPNVEHPKDLITPRRLITGSVKRWWMQPRPWACDWFDPAWFPRCVFFGAVPDHLPDNDAELAEVQSGYLAPGVKQRQRAATFDNLVHRRSGDAASPALVLPFMKGDEAIRFRGMTPSGEVVVRLPGAAPKIFVRHRRRAAELKPVPNRIVVSLDERGVYIVWHASWVAPDEVAGGKGEGEDGPKIEVLADKRPVPILE